MIMVQAAIERILHIVGPLLADVTTRGIPEPIERVVWGLIPLTALVMRNIFGHRPEVLDLVEVPELQGSVVWAILKHLGPSSKNFGNPQGCCPSS